MIAVCNPNAPRGPMCTGPLCDCPTGECAAERARRANDTSTPWPGNEVDRGTFVGAAAQAIRRMFLRGFRERRRLTPIELEAMRLRSLERFRWRLDSVRGSQAWRAVRALFVRPSTDGPGASYGTRARGRRWRKRR